MVVVPQTTTRPELGVLFVHGIGEQRQGQTLVRFADPISRWLARWLSRGGHTEAGVGTLDETRIAVGETVLGGEEPAHAYLTIDSAPGLALPGRHRWLLAESWWAETFQPPKTASLLLWMLLILPYVTVIQFSEMLRRASRRPRWKGWIGRVTRAARVVLFLLVYVLALPLAAVGALGVALLLVALLIPLPAIQTRAKKLALLLSNTLGDSYVLTSSAVQFDAMVTRVASDLEWVSTRARNVVVLAHSQGTAVSYAAITASGTPANLRGFVTVGEAIKKLQLMRGLQTYGEPRTTIPVERPRRRGLHLVPERLERIVRLKSLRFALAWIGLVGIFLIAFALPQLIVLGHAQHTHLTRGIVCSVLGFVMAAGVLWVCGRYWMEDFTRDPEPLAHDGKPVRWADFFASADPVPNGPLFSNVEGKDWLSERQVWNLASVLRDHTSYTSSEDDFLGCAIAELVRATGGRVPEDTREALRRARWRGWWRVWWLAFGRAGAAVAAVATVLRVSGQLTHIGNRVIAWHWWEPVRWVGKHVVEWLRKLAIVGHPTDAQIVGILTVVAIGVAGYAVLAAMWSYWQKQDIKRFYQRLEPGRDTDPLGGRELLLFLTTLGIEGAIAAVVGLTRDYAAVWNWCTENPWAVAAILVVGVGIAPIVLSWILREPLRRLEGYLMRTFPTDVGEPEPSEAPEAPGLAVAQP
jgi:hypothetical protein